MSDTLNWKTKSGVFGSNYVFKANKKVLSETIISTVRDVMKDETIKPQRGGVIMYGVLEGITYFGLAKDSQFHELTDFGGGIKYKEDKNAVEGALREFNEESLKIFKKIENTDIENNVAIYDSKNILIFLKVENLDPNAINKKFEDRYAEHYTISTKEPEVCGIVWLNHKKFWELIQTESSNYQMYSRVKNFLYRAQNLEYKL